MYPYYPSETPEFKNAETDEKKIKYFIDQVRKNDQQFREYCKKNGVDEAYEYVEAFISLDPTNVNKEQIQQIFDKYIIVTLSDRSPAKSKKSLNLNHQQTRKLILAFEDFIKEETTEDRITEIIELLGGVVGIVALLVVSNIPQYDGASRSSTDSLIAAGRFRRNSASENLGSPAQPTSVAHSDSSCCRGTCGLF